MKHLIIFFVLGLFCFSCQENNNKKYHDDTQEKKISNQEKGSSQILNQFENDYLSKYDYSNKDSLLFFSLFGNLVLQENEDSVLQDFRKTENKFFDLLPGIVEKALKTNYDDLEPSTWISYSDKKSIFTEIKDNDLIDFVIKIVVKQQFKNISFSEERILESLETLKVVGYKLLPLNKENGETLFKVIYSKERLNEKYISTVTILKKFEFPTHYIEMTLVSDLSSLSVSN